MDFQETVLFDEWHFTLLGPKNFSITDGPRAKFHRLWLSKFTDGLLPARSDFEFEDFQEIFGWVAIEEILYEPFDLLTKLHGSELANIDIGDVTGTKNSDHHDDPLEGEHQKFYLKLHEAAAKDGYVAHSWGRELQHNIPFGTDWISFPCANDGINVSHFITIAHKCMLRELDGLVVHTPYEDQ